MSEHAPSNKEGVAPHPEKINNILPEGFFTLQTNFAFKLAKKRNLSLSQLLLQATSFHSRLFNHPTKGLSSDWQNLIDELPETEEEITDLIYNQYLDKNFLHVEQDSKIETFGCFSYNYKEAAKRFMLHFGNNDPDGPLAHDRIKNRLQDLHELTFSIKEQGEVGSTIHMSSWLLSIEAFRRLLPPEFVSRCQIINIDSAQDNGLWGQFLDKDGGIKQDLADKLLENAKDPNKSISECFPLKLQTASAPQEVFFDHYLT